jgi:hypothetical protein
VEIRSTSATLGILDFSRPAIRDKESPYATRLQSSRERKLWALRQGVRRGLVSIQERQGWPQNVWAVAPNSIPLEAMLENPAAGAYHGYPMLKDDPLADEVLERWRGQ